MFSTEKRGVQGQISMRSSGSKGYLPTLDGWRAIAILGVLGDHLFWGNPSLGRFGHIAIGLMGEKGVTLFFGISGFLITWRLLEERERFGAIGLRAFYIRRACRILPASTMYLAVVGLLALGGFLTLNPHSWLSALLFYRDYSNISDWFTGHFWSLSIEEHFYFFWPVLLVFLGLKRAVRTACCLALAVVAWRWLEWSHQWIGRYLPSVGFWFRTDTQLDAFLCACLVAILCFKYGKLSAWAWACSLLIYFACALQPRRSSAATTFELGLSLCVPLLLAGTVLNPHWGISRMLELRPLRWLGRISYSVYLWQQLFLGNGRTGLLPLRIAAAMMCAGASFYLIEKPMIRLGHRLAPPATSGRGDLREITVSSDTHAKIATFSR
jgi:peptidoglycan/LPS O-acetylase OafA/YrhL